VSDGVNISIWVKRLGNGILEYKSSILAFENEEKKKRENFPTWFLPLKGRMTCLCLKTVVEVKKLLYTYKVYNWIIICKNE
jgi:hypothetical protein